VLPEVFSGAFRSTHCQRVRGSDDAQLDDGMCAKCASIKKKEDFRGRMKRSWASNERADHTRLSCFGRSELLQRSRRFRQQVKALQFQVYFQCRRIATMKGRKLELKERIEEAAGRGDVRKIVDELVRAQSTLQQKPVLLNFIHDLAKNANAISAKGKRWSTSTKNLYEVRTCFNVESILHHVMLHLSTPYHAIPHHIVIPYRIIPHRVRPHPTIIPYHATPRHVIPHHIFAQGASSRWVGLVVTASKLYRLSASTSGSQCQPVSQSHRLPAC
jgi:hypothetical protein